MTLSRVEGVLGISVRGGAEHSLPLIVSRLAPGTPAALCKHIFIGDAIIASKHKKSQMRIPPGGEMYPEIKFTVKQLQKYEKA